MKAVVERAVLLSQEDPLIISLPKGRSLSPSPLPIVALH